MKTFRFIGMALLAIVMCVNFASCSDDDEIVSRVASKLSIDIFPSRDNKFVENSFRTALISNFVA